MKKINLIWQTKEGDETEFEIEYLRNLIFKEFEKIEIFDNKTYNTVLNDSVIIYSNNSDGVSEEFISYLKKYKENNYTFYLFHLSNENLNHNYEYYELSNHVFRTYFDEKIITDKILFVPLGVKSGFLNKKSDFSLNQKDINFSFIGQPKSDRGELISILESLPNNFIHKTNSWNCSTSISQNECINIYMKTKFVPCPMGWSNPDSYRIMESLESGSIPIIKKYDNLNYFEKVWGNSPIPVVSEWEELINFSNLSDKEYFDLYKRVFDWYPKFKENLSLNIKNIIK
jgi:hypothetical protein